MFDKQGRLTPVTVIEAGPCSVLATKTKDKDGYCATVLGYEDVKESKVTKPKKGWFKKIKSSPKKVVREMRAGDDSTDKPGDAILVTSFKVGDYLDISGITKGKGFQGGVKRWKWAGGESGHGSMFHRAPGSIGASSYPSRVFKGQHLPGHMGSVKRTVQSIRIMIIDEEKNLLVVEGSVPGHKNTLLVIKHAKKRKAKEEAQKTPEKSKGK